MNITTIAIIIATLFVIIATLLPTFIMNRKKKTSEEDWAVASRSLPMFVVIGTQFASIMGGGVLVGHVASAYRNGVGHMVYGVLVCSPLLVIMLIARWLRHNNFTTIPEIFDNFCGENKIIKVIAAVMTIIVPFGWVTSQITAFGSIYSELTGLNYNTICIIFAIVSLLFIMPAGLKTVAWTDFIFSCFIVVFMIASLLYATNMAGGTTGIVNNAEPHLVSIGGSLQKIGWSTIFLWIFAILPGGVTNQLYFQRVCAMEDESKVNRSLFISFVVSLIGFTWAVYMGISINSVNPNIADNGQTGWFMSQLPLPLLAAFAALVFATLMSTVSSGVQSAVVNITRDIIPSFKKNIPPEKMLQISRMLSGVTMVVALLMCLVFTDTLGWLTVTYGFSAATLLCPIYVGYAFRNKNFITSKGIGASMIAGAIGATTGLILKTTINYAAIGVCLSFITLIVVSAMTSKVSNKVKNLNLNN
ncbi:MULTISPECIES: sodium:solute symporter family protein [unclassified Sedimentibacter]|uniref:sodium:solute symporter family protein n=1 Tax=unclassified Sedimentibacter TaxID=2649220 RepID=UPI0027DF4318|nr:sodium:solute symporter family protein [Sedimentibacter sp. MB35-C1]WMJ76903.1 sodium:solute symporter family protein [Sedimentibacter sp. MB35-C1]